MQRGVWGEWMMGIRYAHKKVKEKQRVGERERDYIMFGNEKNKRRVVINHNRNSHLHQHHRPSP